MNFKEFFTLFNENIDQNFENWLEILIKYAKPDEKDAIYYNSDAPEGNQGKRILAERAKNIIKSVLKEKNLENFNWFSFCVGYYTTKQFMREDLEMAIDVTKKAIDNGTLPKSEIGQKGWFKIGKESQNRISEYLAKENSLSNRELERRKKRGEADLDENLVKLVASEESLKLYHLPRIKLKVIPLVRNQYSQVDKDSIRKRHEILCKLGKDTEWCTAQPSWDAHESYVDDDIYIIHKNDKPIYQFVSCVNGAEENRQFMDADDHSIKSLDSTLFNFLNKHVNREFSCYNLKIFLTSVQDLLDLKDTDRVDFISINRLITKNSGKWNDKALKYYHNKTNKILPVSKGLNPTDSDSEEEKQIKQSEFLAKITDTEDLKKSEEKVLISIFKKLISFVDDGLKQNRTVHYNIIDTIEKNLKYSVNTLGLETFRFFKKEIEKYKTLLDI